MSALQYPQDLRYTHAHEWVRVDGASVRMGITAFAQDALGDVVYVSLPSIGDAVSAGEACGEIESTKSVNEIYAPFDGEVSAVNDRLEDSPELINSDPYGDGWIVELAVEEAVDVEELLDAATYAQHVQ